MVSLHSTHHTPIALLLLFPVGCNRHDETNIVTCCCKRRLHVPCVSKLLKLSFSGSERCLSLGGAAKHSLNFDFDRNGLFVRSQLSLSNGALFFCRNCQLYLPHKMPQSASVSLSLWCESGSTSHNGKQSATRNMTTPSNVPAHCCVYIGSWAPELGMAGTYRPFGCSSLDGSA